MTQSLEKSLRDYTPARVGLHRAGDTLATKEVLDFQLAHAQARDAVHATMDVAGLLQGLRERGWQSVVLQSAAKDRAAFLRHPERGRNLTAESSARLMPALCDIAFILADGLSALAVARHALPLLDHALPLLPSGCTIGPICIAEQARVAIGDTIGAALQAKVSVVLIGERPGLNSPDSLGAYLTWSPRPGRHDAERNCVSNIRPEGLDYPAAARMLSFYLHESLRQKLSGISLKLTLALP
jgi:ethanolamine ammonia-lyase small subunit